MGKWRDCANMHPQKSDTMCITIQEEELVEGVRETVLCKYASTVISAIQSLIQYKKRNWKKGWEREMWQYASTKCDTKCDTIQEEKLVEGVWEGVCKYMHPQIISAPDSPFNFSEHTIWWLDWKSSFQCQCVVFALIRGKKILFDPLRYSKVNVLTEHYLPIWQELTFISRLLSNNLHQWLYQFW